VPYTPIPLEFERLTPREQLARSQEFLERVRNRRSVRQFSREPVPFELVANAVAAAGTAGGGPD
jgi:iodotyrosine deiodinase